jgi:hypothetical protein
MDIDERAKEEFCKPRIQKLSTCKNQPIEDKTSQDKHPCLDVTKCTTTNSIHHKSIKYIKQNTMATKEYTQWIHVTMYIGKILNIRESENLSLKYSS